MAVEEKEDRGVATLERALAILGTFESSPSQSLAEMSRRTGLYKSTLLRLLGTLEKFGYVGQQADGSYHVGVAALHLGSLYQRWVKPAELIDPVLRKLVEQTGESSSFNVQEGDVRVCVYRVDSPQKIRDHVRVGDLLPLTRGAAGKVMLAFGDEAGEPRWKELRESCFCCTKGEIEADTAAIAAPVFAAGGVLEGALAITGPGFRFSDEKVESMRLALLRAACALSRDFGGSTAALDAAVHRAQLTTSA
ncbi:MAG: IclR family transcriptional regulator [Ramlibacter sp.]|jgi:DNA-binding IclR family transcriptional regulator|nr:IclR family transcriptional regulator [Ramlibacter sp.]MDB5914306.1 IclR family transcriptional regulator [Ramlibacter sp.]